MRLIPFFALLVLISLPALADEPATALVERTDFVQEVAAEGRVAPGEIVEVRMTPLTFKGRYTVLSALEPGRIVKEGEEVMRLDDRVIKKALKDARISLSVAESEFAAQMLRLKMKAYGAELELTGKRRELQAAERALKKYLEFTLPRSTKRAARDAKSFARSVENSRDELAQLEKMYAEDELVDDTEEIVLKRARWDLENRLLNQESRLEQREFDVEVTEKERRKALEFSLRQRRFSHERALLEFKLGLVARTIEAEKALRSIEDRRRHVAELAADLSDFVLLAPAAGILLHGGRIGSLDRKYKRGDQFSPESVAFIIAAGDSLRADLSVPAADILRVSPGQSVRLKLVATGLDDLMGTIATRSILPRGGRIPLTVSLESPVATALLGIAIKGKVVIAEHKDVLVVPLAAVQREGTKALCRRPLEGGGTRLVPVILGPDDGKRVVVLEGLEEGDEVLVGEPRE